MPIRLSIAILALLLCAIVARGDKPTVMKDSDAVQYAGKDSCRRIRSQAWILRRNGEARFFALAVDSKERLNPPQRFGSL
jgi:hypothetical protein